ncbi:hypothetical protein Q5752_002101 [Cryptotrichosporon argae]
MGHGPPSGPPANHASSSRDPFADPSASAPASASASASAPAAGLAEAHTLDPPIPDEPPPAYSSVAGSLGVPETSLASGPARPDFSGPPPLPDRLDSTATGGVGIPGVGYGYGWPGDYGGELGDGFSAPQLQHMHTRPPHETVPTDVPTPGRLLLYKNQLLVYPRGHFCTNCQNTGFKNNDPSHPCASDWRKFGKPYTSALAHSFSLAPRAGSNASTAEAANFQRPLADFRAAGAHPLSDPHPQALAYQPYQHQPPLAPHALASPAQPFSPSPFASPAPTLIGNGNPYAHLPPPPAAPLPPPLPTHHPVYAPAPPPGALVVAPGDPRIGGRLCRRCGGDGRELTWLGFDDGPCWDCGGSGRIF